MECFLLLQLFMAQTCVYLFYSTMTAQEKVKVLEERSQLQKERSEMYSLWRTELYRLSIANKVKNINSVNFFKK